MYERVRACRRSVLMAVCVSTVLTTTVWGEPYVSVGTPAEWRSAQDTGRVLGLAPPEWSSYMAQWQSYLQEGEPYPSTVFLPPELYVTYGETDPTQPVPSGLVMLWGGLTPLPDGQYASAWKYDYQVDPDLSKSTISLSVFAPQARPGANGLVQINQVSFGIRDINGNTRSWYWNVGPGKKIPWNLLVAVIIDATQTGVNATSPPADSYMSNPAFDITRSQFFIADENGLLVGALLPIPPPPAPHPGIWNLWHDIVVRPHWDYKWQQPPDPAHPTDTFYGWNQHSEWWYGPVVADDWICTTPDPVTDVHWWGSYVNWDLATEPPQLPDHFHILIWTDVPAPPGGFSHPGQVIHEIVCYNFTKQFVGWDYDPRMNRYEACWHFDQTLQPGEYFFQDPGGGQNIYWISISACYNGAQPQYPWGWKTRPSSSSPVATDDAVVITDPVQPQLNSQYGSGTPIGWPTPQESWDMAFELTTGAQPQGKWGQPPDTSPMGLDVMATRKTTPYILADDFPCTQTGPITQIVVFGSWYHDMMPPPAQVTFTLSLHSNIPVGPGGFSIPGPVLWWRDFLPGQYTQEPFGGLQEGWLTPPSNYESFGDTVMWRYAFNLNPGEFIQQGTPQNPVIYWLDVQARVAPEPNPFRFGWKTSPMHWNDAAVWGIGFEPFAGPWQMLRYPPGHPQANQPIDLAFEIMGQAAPGTKWTQPPAPYDPPDAFNGWDQYSVYGGQSIVADDWFCQTDDPVSDIHWWGSFIGWYLPFPPQLPDAFLITIWTDVPAGPGGFSHPGTVIWQNYCTTYEATFAGWDFDPHLGTPASPPEPTFKFTQYLDRGQWFWQEPGPHVYWISIAAVYAAGTDPPNPFGWKTRPHEISPAPDDAVIITNPTAPVMGSVFVGGAPLEYPAGTSWDMAFELTTTPPSDLVVCEPQDGPQNNPIHPTTYWYDVTPFNFGRCDFHVRVFDPDPNNYKNVVSPPTWQFAVHQVGSDWWASWWDPDCSNAIFNTFRFQFDNRNPSTWGDWTTTISGTNDPNDQVIDRSANHATEFDGYGYRVHVPREMHDTVVCEPQGVVNNPFHPPTYWYDVTPELFGRCDFHVRVLDPNPLNYTNVVAPLTWQFSVHQVGPAWWASWWDPDCDNAIFNTFRFQFDNPSASTWGDWTTTIGASSNPLDQLIDRSERHTAEADGYGYRVHVPQSTPVVEACCLPNGTCQMRVVLDCLLNGGVPQGPGTTCDPPFVCPYHKWSQGPTTDAVHYPYLFGWNELSAYNGPQVVSDDWQCVDQRPVTDIHWWGSYLGWTEPVPPPTAPLAFHIGVWIDVPVGPGNPFPFSHPGLMFHEWFVLRAQLNERAVAMDEHPAHGVETCFQYDLRLPPEQWFWQDRWQHIFWISISAVYGSPCNGDFDGDGDVDQLDIDFFVACLVGPPNPACWRADLNGDGLVNNMDLLIMQCQAAAGWPNPACCQMMPPPPSEWAWGWKTRLPHWNDDAIRIFAPLPPRMHPGWQFMEGLPLEDPPGESWDAAFVLTTPYAPPPLPCKGDMNCDRVINFGDINPFVLALSNPDGYQRALPGCRFSNADCNGDGVVNFGDINPFVALLTNPPPCP